MRFQAPRGTEDVLPDDASRWLRLETLFRDVARRYGYGELRTPTFEDTALFTRTAGETSDIVTKEMYTFVDKGDRSITLKPEGTAPAMRAVIEHSLCPPGTVTRLCYVTPCFRYSRPQKGRLRELHQCGLELIGSSSAVADAEVIELTVRFLQALGLQHVTVLLNSIGRDECRLRYRDAILAHVEPFLATRGEEYRAQTEKNPLRLLDSKDTEVHRALEGLPPISDFYEDESRARFEEIQRLLTEADVPFKVSPEIVRGLDYYTETVFEIQHPGLGEGVSLCGGGRYDNLVKELGGSATPSVGVGIGIERVLLAMEAEGVTFAPVRPLAFVVNATPEAFGASQRLARTLRDDGLSVQSDIDGKSMKSQLRQADKSGARFALVMGGDELGRGTVQLKDLVQGEQEEVPVAEASARLRARL
ncbi:MAG: histidine--tRNA ligase [Fimbriimonas sp.]